MPTAVYQTRLETVERLGHRTISIGGIHDPVLISQIDDSLEKVRLYTQNLFPDLNKRDNCRLIYHVCGGNAFMGPLESRNSTPYGFDVMGEVLASTKERSHAIANNARTSILHVPYERQLATTVNFASPLSPHEQDAGEVFKVQPLSPNQLEPGEEGSLISCLGRGLQVFPTSCTEEGTLDG